MALESLHPGYLVAHRWISCPLAALTAQRPPVDSPRLATHSDAVHPMLLFWRQGCTCHPSRLGSLFPLCPPATSGAATLSGPAVMSEVYELYQSGYQYPWVCLLSHSCSASGSRDQVPVHRWEPAASGLCSQGVLIARVKEYAERYFPPP
jgi:hypothetical protein